MRQATRRHGDVDFGAEDGTYTGLLAVVVVPDGTEHVVVVGDPDGPHVQLPSAPRELLDLDRADQEGELRVDVEVYELDCHGPELARPPRMVGQNVGRLALGGRHTRTPTHPGRPTRLCKNRLTV